VKAALRLARILHFFTWLILLAFGWLAGLGMPYSIAMVLIFFALVFEHVLCRSGDLARINTAFFNMNALVGLILVIGVAVGIYWPERPILMNGHVVIFSGGYFR
jgi:4-hydroxybenzoate polyprenyltransferase